MDVSGGIRVAVADARYRREVVAGDPRRSTMPHCRRRHADGRGFTCSDKARPHADVGVQDATAS
jgi:hypothetical protein